MTGRPQRLDGAECRRSLGERGVGRLVFTEDALPAVATLNYVVRAGALHFRTAAGTAVARCAGNAVVAFNVSPAVDPARGDAPRGAAWSVTVTGRCRRADPGEEVRAALQAWAPGPREEFFSLDLALLEGFRLD
ncbi:pyridoxamine 5'-phosphate oxidase family protein [Kineococcus sp. SYSU DK002]|uniref:pyridoxamine 5'-phosphate oxidase family protein n=1 Tax=Kineococcus sp. SYSU DK002 TaxID=3383123 RepID=UPI003D7E51A2